MSKYTTELRYIIESYNHNTSSASNTVDEMIEVARSYIFNFNYPIYDENYRAVLEHKILRHFYTREIGMETFGLWQLKLNDKMNMIMPYYNQLYASTLLEIDPLQDTDITKQFVRKNNGESDLNNDVTSNDTGNATTTDTEMNKHSDTPQSMLSGLDYYSEADDNTRNNTTDTKMNSTSNQTSKNTVTNTEDYIETLIGNNGKYSASELLNLFRGTFLNIDQQVINELNELFMLLW